MSDYVDDLIQSPQPVEAEIVEDDLMISSASFEIDMSGIQSDVAELTEAIDDALTVYGESLVDEEQADDAEVEEESEFCSFVNEDGVKCRNHARPGSRYCGIHAEQE